MPFNSRVTVLGFALLTPCFSSARRPCSPSSHHSPPPPPPPPSPPSFLGFHFRPTRTRPHHTSRCHAAKTPHRPPPSSPEPEPEPFGKDIMVPIPGNVFCFICHHLYKPNYHYRQNKMLKQEHWRSKKHYSLKTVGASISCSSGEIKDADPVFSIDQLSNAHIIYCVAPAMGHNQEAHPESHFRVPAITSALEKMELTPKHRGSDVIELQNFKPATIDEIVTIHSRAYVFGLEKAMSQASQDGLIFIEGSGPTYATANTFQESLIAAGAGISLVDSVIAASNISRNPPVGFALIRPPGHHAIPKGPMGFCVFGNIAVAARHAQHAHRLKKVFIIDFDVHHGNGTSDAFYDDPDIFFLSTHQDGSYPGTGKIEEVGHGNGEGTTLNLPLPGGSGDTTMRSVFEEVIAPCAQRFKPDIILVSAGYDAHVLDPLASLQFTTGTYYMLATKIKELAADLCKGRCIFFLEGGYNLQSLSYSVADSFRAFLNEPSSAQLFDDPAILYEEPSTKVRRAIERVKHIHSL